MDKPVHERAKIISLLTDGNGLSAITKIVGCSIRTVTRLPHGCRRGLAAYRDEQLRELGYEVIEADEIWSSVARTRSATSPRS